MPSSIEMQKLLREIEQQPAKDTAAATAKLVEILAAMDMRAEDESKRRGRGEKVNRGWTIAGVSVGVLTLAATIAGILAR